MVLQYFYSSEYSLMLFGETWKCKVWMHYSGKFANSSEFNVTSTDGTRFDADQMVETLVEFRTI